MKSLSIVIPAYNEESRVVPTLKDVLNYMKGKDFEVIVVDDGSKDDTTKVVEQLKSQKIRILKNMINKGKGFSVKRGVLEAKKEWVLFMDADNATSIREIEKFVPYLDDYDVLIGSRNLKESIITVKQPFTRRFPGKVFSFIVRLILWTAIKDTQCGFKVFKKGVIKNIFGRQTIDRWGFDAELLYLAKKKGFRIKEVPIVWVNDEDTRLNLFSSSIGMFIELLKIRVNDLMRKY